MRTLWGALLGKGPHLPSRALQPLPGSAGVLGHAPLHKGTQGWGPSPSSWAPVIALEEAPRTKDRLAREAEKETERHGDRDNWLLVTAQGRGRAGLCRVWGSPGAGCRGFPQVTSPHRPPEGGWNGGREEGRSQDVGPPGVRVQPAQLPERTPDPRKDRDAVGLARASPGWGGCPCPARGCGEELGASTSVLSDPPMHLHLHHAPAPAQCRHLPHHLQACSLPPAATWELCSLPAEQTPPLALVGVRVTKDGRRAPTAPPLPGAIVPTGWGRRQAPTA